MNAAILLVDDEPDFLEVIGEFLTDEGYRITCARNGAEALQRLSKETFDLMLSDVNMPGMKGFELIQKATMLYPDLKTALITAYDVRDYINMAREYNIGNIITKTTPFNFDEVKLLIANILTEEVFGLDRYVDAPVTKRPIAASLEIEPMIQTIINAIPHAAHKRKFRHALGEIIINAVYYGAKCEKGDRKDAWPLDVKLKPEEIVTVSWAVDREKAGVAVTDQKGRLTKKEILFWLERNTTKGEDGLSRGVYDDHGKGLFITRETTDRLIINIKRGVSSEVVMLNYREGTYDGHRPLWIQEV